MTDSPAFSVPLDPSEQPILNSVLYIRDQLSLLKQDKSTYIKSHDVFSLYDQVVKQVHLLNDLRKEHCKPLEQNRGSEYNHCEDPGLQGLELMTLLTYLSSGLCLG